MMLQRRTRDEAATEKRHAVNVADASGLVADSMEVRAALIAKVKAGEMTLTECQEELNRIKRNAKRNGLTTRAKVWSKS